MRAGNESKVPAFSSRWLLAIGLAASFGAAACNGDIGPGASGTPNPTGMGSGSAGTGITGGSNPGAAGNGLPPGVTGTAGTGGGAGVGGGAGTGVVVPPPGTDPGRISIHRLNNLEYDNTIRDLLGTPGAAQMTFQPDEQGEFDNTADAFTMNDARYEQYFNAADTLGETVFANAALKAKIMTCTPSATPKTDTCANTIITNFGKRAWRRPLDATEVARLQTLAADAVTLGETAEGGIKQVVKTMLAAPQFLYRIEFDASPASLMAHPLSGYELASRLSYLGWSSMPDDMMFAAAANNSISTDVGIAQTIDRMLADTAKGNTFTQSFAGQWLGARDMKGHQVEPTAFKAFDEPLRNAMINEQLAFFNEFFTAAQPQPFTSFFTYDANFVDARLASHYQFPAVTAFTKVTNTTDTRVGFMGLASFLTFTSFSYRTAPTLRGKWVLLNLLCQTIPDPPANVPKLDSGAANNPDLQSQNVRIKLAAHRTQTDCAACHATLDPIGLGLENFDAIGSYRTKYANNDVIDSSGVLPTKEMFSTVAQLAGILSQGSYQTKLTDCVSKKMMTYALSRALGQSDQPYLDQVRAQWSLPAQGWNLKNLLKDIVLNDTFRNRRGEQ